MTETVFSAGAAGESNQQIKYRSLYSQVMNRVRDAGLLKKTPGFYVMRLVYITLFAVASWAGLALVSAAADGAWWGFAAAIPLVMALGIFAAQYGFIAHEAAHRQVFHSNKANDRVGLVLANLFAGMGYGFWLRKHNRHHASPNQINKDPDIDIPVLSFTPEALFRKSGIEKLVSKQQGRLFPVLLMFTSFHFVLDSVYSLVKKNSTVKNKYLEAALMVVRQTVPIVAFVFLFGAIQGLILYMIFMFSIGVFIGGAFAPNHKGMPLVPEDSKVDFFHRQVLTSRNISPSWLKDNMMGGLNYQVEHHLFPSMPRPHLSEAHKIVVQFCAEQNVPFTEVGLFKSYGMVMDYLNKVGLSNESDPFVCPMVAEWRPRS